jgi:hypothetical protein
LEGYVDGQFQGTVVGFTCNTEEKNLENLRLGNSRAKM